MSNSRFAWARFNAYGVLICGLLFLSVMDLLDPEHSEVAQLVGRAPALQPVWTSGFIAAALLILYGFARARAMPEVAGLAVMTVALATQTFVEIEAGGDVFRGLAVLVLVAGLAVARTSVLFGYDVTISHRRQSR